ncbi:hypothetical protein POM88_038767 [Heracleum sosnowskyi]|uniref:Cytochrome P450 n=1 Tax=Heracleum sosnowskyi TaxID=360622 RepID=A0AAD8HB06_9APIA|nr:hypothetical protein POM88_038767 [Heracleum sosnowskyi]
MMTDFVRVIGGFDVGTYIPRLAWLSSVIGLYNKVDAVAKEFDTFLERIVDEHISTSKREKVEGAEDFVDVLLQIYNDKSITGYCFAGTDTTYTVLEWTMVELLRHSQVMKKLQNELRLFCRNKSVIIAEDDCEKMRYLKAVIKEILRMHPPIPLG